VSDFTEAVDLITGLQAEQLLADKGYESDEIVRFAKKQGMPPVIPLEKLINSHFLYTISRTNILKTDSNKANEDGQFFTD